MDGRQGSKGTLERARKLGTGVWVRYLTTGAVLAVTRVALLVWINHQAASHIYTATNRFIGGWLYPESVVALFWPGFPSDHTQLYLVLGSLVTVGSFIMATPILFVGWLRRRHLIVQIAICGLTFIAVCVLLVMIVRLAGV